MKTNSYTEELEYSHEKVRNSAWRKKKEHQPQVVENP